MSIGLIRYFLVALLGAGILELKLVTERGSHRKRLVQHFLGVRSGEAEANARLDKRSCWKSSAHRRHATIQGSPYESTRMHEVKKRTGANDLAIEFC